MRTTDDKKDYNIRVRLNEQMYSHINHYANARNISFSSYVRDLINKDIVEKTLAKKFQK